MDLMVYDHLEAFLEANLAFLNAAEAENNSFLGALGALAMDPDHPTHPVYLAAVVGRSGAPLIDASCRRTETSFSAPPNRNRGGPAPASLLAIFSADASGLRG